MRLKSLPPFALSHGSRSARPIPTGRSQLFVTKTSLSFRAPARRAIDRRRSIDFRRRHLPLVIVDIELSPIDQFYGRGATIGRD